MGQRCSVCKHPARAQIELAISRGMAYRQITKRWGVDKSPLSNHRRRHMPEALVAKLKLAGKPSEIDLEQLRQSESEGLLQRLVWQRGKLHQLLEMAEEVSDITAATRVHGRLLENLTLTARLLGEIAVANRTTVNQLIVAPEYLALRQCLWEILRPHPELRRQVARALAEIEGREPHADGLHPPKAPVLEAVACSPAT